MRSRSIARLLHLLCGGIILAVLGAIPMNAAEKEEPKKEEAKKEEPKPVVKDTKANVAKSMNNLRNLALAIHTYHDANNKLPEAAILDKKGKPLLSWRVTILPYIEEAQLYKQFKMDEPWDSAHNIKLLPKMPKPYEDPRFQAAGKAAGKTYYQGFTGKDAFWGQNLAVISNGLGTSKTVMLVEAGEPVPWTKPADLDSSVERPLVTLGGPNQGDVLTAYCDGHVARVAGINVKPRELKPQEVEDCWVVLGNQDFLKSGKAVAMLAGDPKQTVAFVKDKLKPAGAAAPVDAKKIEDLIKQLDSDSFEEREKAEVELKSLGASAMKPMQATLDAKPSPEVRKRLENLLSVFTVDISSADRQKLRAIGLLEKIGTPEALEVLQAVSKGTGEAVMTEAAKKALQRMEKKESN